MYTLGKCALGAMFCYSTLTTLSFTRGAQRASADSSVRNGIERTNRSPVASFLLTQAAVHGRSAIDVMIVTVAGRTSSVVERVKHLGGHVITRFDEIGYARVRLAPARYEELRAIPNLVAIEVDGSARFDTDADRTIGITMAKLDSNATTQLYSDGWRRRQLSLPVLDAERLRADPSFTPGPPIRADQFIRSHPSFDGRGVTIAVHESDKPDFTHPALQVAQTLTGASVAKFGGLILYGDSAGPPPDARMIDGWSGSRYERYIEGVQRATQVERSRIVTTDRYGVFEIDGHKYCAPHVDTFSFGVYAPPGGGQYAVVWQREQHRVWVDTDQDRDFRNESPLSDINVRFAAAAFRSGPLSGASFVIALDAVKRDRVYVVAGQGAHVTFVSGAAAGQGFLGTKVGGVAPSARLVAVDPGGVTVSGFIEGLIQAARRKDVDVVTSSAGCSDPFIDGWCGGEVGKLVVDRIRTVYEKLVFVAANNYGPETQTARGAPAPAAISVGAYTSDASFRALYGWRVSRADAIPSFSSRGPGDDGSMSPALLATSPAVGLHPCGDTEGFGQRVLGSVRLTTCYQLAGGTSHATPVAAGAAALLISAAKQRGVARNAARIRWALEASARFLSQWGAHEQGAGLIRVDSAWALLASGIVVPAIEVSASVKHAGSRYLAVRDRGVGLWEREGWHAGERGTRVVRMRRLTGARGVIRYPLHWTSNDGTFVAPEFIDLPLKQTVDLSIEVSPRTPGMHSARLDVLDPATRVPIKMVLAAVVAAETFTRDSAYTIRKSGMAPWPWGTSYFIDIPRGVAAVRVTLAVKKGKLGVRTEGPWPALHVFQWETFPYLYTTESLEERTAGTWTRVLDRPQAGVWELFVGPPLAINSALDSLEYHIDGEFELTVALVSGDVRQVAPSKRASTGSNGSADTVSVGIVNRFAPLVRAATVMTPGVQRRVLRSVAADRDHPTLDIRVDTGTTLLRVQAAALNVSEGLDLYLYRCLLDGCHLVDMAILTDSSTLLSLRNPPPGQWKAVVDPSHIRRDSVTVMFTEFQGGPRFGTDPVLSSSAERRSEESWVDRGVIAWIGSAPPFGWERAVHSEVVDYGMEDEEKAHPLADASRIITRPVSIGSGVTTPPAQ